MIDRKYPDSEIEASIKAKTAAAMAVYAATGRDLRALSPEEMDTIANSVDLTPDEARYSSELEIHHQVLIAIGRRVVQPLNENNCRVSREDLIPCIQAYFDVVDDEAGEAA